MRFKVLASLCLAILCGCAPDKGKRAASVSTQNEEATAYALPSDSVTSLLAELVAIRDREGKIILKGRLLLPLSTKVMLSLRKLGAGRSEFAQSEVHLDESGSFETEGFSDGRSPLAPGPYHVEAVSYFNEIWQTPEVLARVGAGGALLPSRLLVPDDAEFPKNGGHFNLVRKIVAPSAPPELIAIEAVKNARLSTPESGRSADPISGVVALMESAYAKTDPDNLRSTGWSAAVQPDGRWVVTMDYLDTHRPRQAHWEFDPRSRHVRYLDAEAKIFSWSPNY